MVKIIFSDFDETLVDYYEGNVFSDYCFSVLDRVIDSGIKFVVVSGRPISFFKGVSGLYDYIDYIISSNGGEIYDVKKGEVIYSNYIDEGICRDIIGCCRDNGIKFYVNCGVDRYCHKDYIVNYDNICQVICIFNDKNMFDYMKDYLVGINGIRISNIVCNDDRCSIDINNIGVSKGNSILYLCNYLGIGLDDTVGFGDSNNDLSMFEVVGRSICVGNSSDVIKQLVDDVCDSCDNEGVFRYIDDYILK